MSLRYLLNDLNVTLDRAMVSDCLISHIAFVFLLLFYCRKRSSIHTKPASSRHNGERIWYRRRNKRLHELHELLNQRVRNVSLRKLPVSFLEHVLGTCRCLCLEFPSYFSFADEVNSEIPEVDFRGRVKRFVQ